jgi:hypothetical protein
MNPLFFHHAVFFRPPSECGLNSSPLITSTAAIKEVTRIHGALRAACRVEVAIMPPADVLFDPALAAKQRRAVWASIKDSSSLRWIVPVAEPMRILKALPEDWLGKGYPNLCLGAIVKNPAQAPALLDQLRSVPVRCRMAYVTDANLPDLRGCLTDVDWVVHQGGGHQNDNVLMLEEACRDAGIPLLRFTQNSTGYAPADLGVSLVNDEEGPLAIHPFGSEVDLRRPTLLPLARPWTHEVLQALTMATQFAKELPAHIALAVAVRGEPGVDCNLEPDSRGVENAEVPNETADAVVHQVGPTGGDCQDFKRLDRVVRRGIAAFKECGRALGEIQDRGLWREGGHSGWEAYLRDVAGMSKPHAHRLVSASRIAEELEVLPTGNAQVMVRPAAESQVRPLCRLQEPTKRAEAWSIAAERSKGQPTAKVVAEVVAELMTACPVARRVPQRNCKEEVTDAFRRLHRAISSGVSSEEIQPLVHNLGVLLKIVPDQC